MINDLLNNYTFNSKAKKKKSRAKDKQKNKLALVVDRWENYYKDVMKNTIQKFKDHTVSIIFQNLREEALKSIELKWSEEFKKLYPQYTLPIMKAEWFEYITQVV